MENEHGEFDSAGEMLQYYFLKEELSDWKIIGSGKRKFVFPVHSFVLSARSLFWRKLTASNFKESQKRVVELDCSEEAITCVLRYMYCFTVELLKLAEHVLEVNYYAEQCELKKLATMCVSAVQSGADTACSIFIESRSFGVASLKCRVGWYDRALVTRNR